MTALDFPASPAVNDTYPNPPVTGTPTYQWDGSDWLAKYPLGGQVIYADVAQNLPDANKVIARKNIYAAPFDAMAYSGMQVNGSFDVSQEKGFDSVATPISGGGSYFCDGWTTLAGSGTAAGYVQVASTALCPGIPKSAAMVIQTAQASMAAGDRVFMAHGIEGYRIARLAWGTANAQSITIGFWTAHVRAGLYSGSIRNTDSSRSCAFSYTQNVTNTWEYKTVTIPGCTDGTWAVDNTKAMIVSFTMASGTNYLAPSTGVWYSTTYLGAVGQINGVAATSDVFRLTGVVVLPGIEVPSAARSPLIMRPYDQELMMCKRYWEKIQVGVVANVTSGGNYGVSFLFSVEKRAPPTLTVKSSAGAGFPTTFGAMLIPITATGGTYYKTANTTGPGSFEDVMTADARI
jgi:hypothetical protein